VEQQGFAHVQEKRKRAGFRQFLKDVRQELRKVDWPNRRQLVSYSVVVLATIVVMTAFVASLDYDFLKGVVTIFG
jgi:preprotein translocase subunit SecE